MPVREVTSLPHLCGMQQTEWSPTPSAVRSTEKMVRGQHIGFEQVVDIVLFRRAARLSRDQPGRRQPIRAVRSHI
jgi:hypothetical protein